ncbi:hypothetical protein CYMTET_43147 [Cymbomonas tetramitiformis]|uniref:Uncharacterized protein n=1 Tax=Cymbomonas tetramitiformis TaxID=36881 RepID=A0AAE0C4U9_9CHLO|nr:hypothetical protein CYMTET_43148 [Cymbomonas tetramitiformis]KAK3247353.1 hypothetical protein CYMTET_43147 [Cymbomonas tetramitiformis]
MSDLFEDADAELCEEETGVLDEFEKDRQSISMAGREISYPVEADDEDDDDFLTGESEDDVEEPSLSVVKTEDYIYAGQVAQGQSTQVVCGVILWKSGSTYEGYFRGDMPHGWGVYRYSSGNSYFGQYRSGKRHGLGQFAWAATQEIYTGNWIGDQRHGSGMYQWKDGAKYEGDWRDGLREGYGMFCWPDGSRYEGQVSGGRREGWGVMTDAEHNKHRGQWDYGRLVNLTEGYPPECAVAVEKAALAASHAWGISLEIPKLLKRANTAADEGKEMQAAVLMGKPPFTLDDFVETEAEVEATQLKSSEHMKESEGQPIANGTNGTVAEAPLAAGGGEVSSTVPDLRGAPDNEGAIDESEVVVETAEPPTTDENDRHKDGAFCMPLSDLDPEQLSALAVCHAFPECAADEGAEAFAQACATYGAPVVLTSAGDAGASGHRSAGGGGFRATCLRSSAATSPQNLQ